MITLIYVLTVLVLLMCLTSAGCGIAGREDKAFKSLYAAGALAMVLFIANWMLAAAPPFGNMRHVMCFFPLVMAPAAWYLKRSRGLALAGWLAGASALALVGALCMPMQAAWRQMPALQSPWFAPHVISYVISYGLMTVAALMVAVGAIRKQPLPPLDCDAADAVVRLAFPFMTFGLWSGALWADAAWGAYWSWDIKEVWALLTWSIYLIYFHVSRHAAFAGWRHPLLLLGFVAVVITFIVVNLLPNLQSLHTYA